MSTLEGIFLWTCVLGYIGAFIATLIGVTFGKQNARKIGWTLMIAASVLQTLAISSRWIATGHMPVMGVYENSLLGAWFLVLIYLASSKWIPAGKSLGVIVAPIVLIMLGNGIMQGSGHDPMALEPLAAEPLALEPLAPAFQSNWLFVHVIFAWLAYGSFFIAACLGVLFLRRKRAAQNGSDGNRAQKRFSDLDIIDNLIFRFLIFGFVADTVMIATGSIWANGLWGRYWGWDPIETWSLVSWLIYGAALHLRITMGWKNSKMAWLTIVSIATVVITFFGIGFISGVHTSLL